MHNYFTVTLLVKALIYIVTHNGWSWAQNKKEMGMWVRNEDNFFLSDANFYFIIEHQGGIPIPKSIYY